MENLEIYESYSQEKTIELKSPNGQVIILKITGGRIKSIENKFNLRFPYREGENYTRSIETWACNNRYKIDGKSPCPPKKVFGIDPKHIPQGHELRKIFPNKFKSL